MSTWDDTWLQGHRSLRGGPELMYLDDPDNQLHPNTNKNKDKSMSPLGR